MFKSVSLQELRLQNKVAVQQQISQKESERIHERTEYFEEGAKLRAEAEVWLFLTCFAFCLS
jgi:hypothetical protein